MLFDDIFALGEVGLSVFSRNKARQGYKEQEASYSEQAALNQNIGAFNARVAEIVGRETCSAINTETRRMIGEQRARFAQMGISMSGSPMFVMGDTLTMGNKKVQEAQFHTEVDKTNHFYAALSATATAKANANQAKWGARSENVNIIRDVMQGMKMMNAGSSAGALPDIFSMFKGIF